MLQQTRPVIIVETQLLHSRSNAAQTVSLLRHGMQHRLRLSPRRSLPRVGGEHGLVAHPDAIHVSEPPDAMCMLQQPAARINCGTHGL